MKYHVMECDAPIKNDVQVKVHKIEEKNEVTKR